METGRGEGSALLAADRMGANPVTTVVVEDSAAGVAAGKAAGMRVIGFSGGGHCGPDHASRPEAAGADIVLTRFTDLPATLDTLVPA